ncbi:MAG: hypothetical protein HEQ32_08365 [Vampirovibrio sp.]
MPLRPTLAVGESASVSTPPPSTQRVGERKRPQIEQPSSGQAYLEWATSQKKADLVAYGEPNKEVKTLALPVVEEKTPKQLRKEASAQRIRKELKVRIDGLRETLRQALLEDYPSFKGLMSDFLENPPEEMKALAKEWKALTEKLRKL